MYKKTTMNTFTDQQIIDEMLKRFIVPQWYTREHIVEIVKYRVYQDVDQTVDEYIENYKEEEKYKYLSECLEKKLTICFGTQDDSFELEKLDEDWEVLHTGEECNEWDEPILYCGVRDRSMISEYVKENIVEEEEEGDHLYCCICEKKLSWR